MMDRLLSYLANDNNLQECRAQLREDERALRAAIKRFTAPFD